MNVMNPHKPDRWVETHDALRARSITPLSAGNGREVWRVEDVTRQVWVLRRFSIHVPQSYRVDQMSIDQWLDQRARLLDWLAQRTYPVTPLLRTRDGLLICSDGHWRGMMTRYVHGSQPALDATMNHALGRALGRLHSLPADDSGVDSWWHPLNRAIDGALGALPAINDVPGEHHMIRAAGHSALEASLSLAALPTSVIHADVWLRNVIIGDAGVVLIDWECAGRGVALLDLASVPGECFDPGDNTVQRTWIAAALAGYLSERAFDSAEFDYLDDAIRFGTAFRGALRLHMGALQGWNDSITRGLTCERARIDMSEMIAGYDRAYTNSQRRLSVNSVREGLTIIRNRK